MWALGAAFLALFVLALWMRDRRLTPFDSFSTIETQILEVGGWHIRYHRSGKGPHLLLLHGIGANLFCWRWIIPFLAKHFTVTAIDLPGFGQSSKPVGEKYGLDEQTSRLEMILEHLGVDRTFVVGNSMGGNIALWFGLHYPDRIKGLSLIAPATSSSLVPLPLERLAWLSGPAAWILTRQAMKWAHGRTVSKAHLVDSARIEETFKTYGRQHQAVRSFLLATAAIRDHRLSQRLSEFQLPVLILWGSRDRLVSRKVIDELADALPKAQSEVHLGGGHHLQEDEPEWVSEKLTSFFQA